MATFRFTAGPWNVHEGNETFGPGHRKSIPLEEKMKKYAEIGLAGMQRPRQQKPRPVRRIVPQELRSLSWAARARRTRSRSRPYIPSRNPIRAAVRQCRITVGLF